MYKTSFRRQETESHKMWEALDRENEAITQKNQ
jgi:hypothetical protein